MSFTIAVATIAVWSSVLPRRLIPSFFGVLKMNVDAEARSAEYDQDTTVVLDKKAGTVNAVGVVADVVNEKIAENRGVYNDVDIRALCGSVIRSAGGVSKRPTGGVYVVPALYADKISALKDALKELCGDNPVIYPERIYRRYGRA